MKLILGLVAMSSVSALAADISGKISLRYTPGLSSTGDVFVSDSIANAIYEQMWSIPVTKGDDYDAKYGDGIACFKFANGRSTCRLTVKFSKP